MKYDVFMRTRTANEDYKWFNKPDYLSANIHETFKSIIALCENPDFGGLGHEAWCSNFFYVRRSGYCLLARVIRTNYADAYGTKIVSFEGVSVKSDNERHLFYNVPSLISEMLPPNKCFRTLFEETGSVNKEFVSKALLNPFDGSTVPDEVHMELKNNKGYSNLLRFTAFGASPEGYVFGKQARAFMQFIDGAGLKIEHAFDYEMPDKGNIDEYAFSESYVPLTCDYKEPQTTGTDKVSIDLVIQETGSDTHKYRWEVRPWDNSVKDPKKMRYVTRYFEMSTQVEFAKLEMQKESLKQFLLDNGWVKQPIGLRFEKKLFQREGM